MLGNTAPGGKGECGGTGGDGSYRRRDEMGGGQLALSYGCSVRSILDSFL